MAKKYHNAMADRRREEMRDAGMIHEDRSAIANLPQGVMMKPWNSSGEGYLPENLDDTINGIERQKSLDHSKMMKSFEPKKV